MRVMALILSAFPNHDSWDRLDGCTIVGGHGYGMGEVVLTSVILDCLSSAARSDTFTL